jgi:hypothetical protein
VSRRAGARTALPALAALAALAVAPSARAQARSPVPALEPPRWRAELLLASTGAYAKDATGTEVTGGVAAGIGAEAVWDAFTRTTASLFTRGAVGQVTVKGGGYRAQPGSAVQLDLGLALERELLGRLAVRAGAGFVWLHGPDAVVPFRDDNDRVHWMGEAGATLRLSNRLPFTATLGFQGFRLGAGTVADPVREAGWVRRLTMGVRYGR